MEPRARRFAGLIGLGLAALFGPGLVQLIQLEWRQRRLDGELRALQTRREVLLNEQRRLTDDPVYVEGLIRTTFKHAKPNEIVIPLDEKKAS